MCWTMHSTLYSRGKHRAANAPSSLEALELDSLEDLALRINELLGQRSKEKIK